MVGPLFLCSYEHSFYTCQSRLQPRLQRYHLSRCRVRRSWEGQGVRPQRSIATHGGHTSPSSERKIYRAAKQRREIHSEEASRATEKQIDLCDAWGPHITFDEALQLSLYIGIMYYILPWASVIGSRGQWQEANHINPVTRCEAPMLLNRTTVELLQILVIKRYRCAQHLWYRIVNQLSNY